MRRPQEYQLDSCRQQPGNKLLFQYPFFACVLLTSAFRRQDVLMPVSSNDARRGVLLFAKSNYSNSKTRLISKFEVLYDNNERTIVRRMFHYSQKETVPNEGEIDGSNETTK